MRLIDLSHEITPFMPCYPGSRPPSIDKASTLEGEGFRELKLDILSHTGTHIDAPFHILKEGRTLDSFPISHFYGNAFMLDIILGAGDEISVRDLSSYECIIKKTEFLLLNTGWYRKWGEEGYFSDFPFLSKEAAEWLAGMDLKGIGVDTISIDKAGSTRLEAHKALLENDILIIENLNALGDIGAHMFIFSCMPLRIMASDGSPVRAFALIKK